MEAERAGFETERRRRVTEYGEEMEEGRRKAEERLGKMEKEHEEEVKVMMEKREEVTFGKKEDLEEETKLWQRRKLEELRESANKNEKEVFDSLREQSEGELDMVIAKLEAQARQERSEIESTVEKGLAVVKNNLESSEVKATEEEQLIMDRYAIDHEKAQLLQEEVALVESRVVGMERRVAITEENLKQETSKALDVKRDAANKLNRIKKGQSRGVELAEIEIESLKKQLQDLDVTLSDFVPVHSKELERIEKRFEKELSSVEDRVRLVLQRKDMNIQELEKEHGRLEVQSVNLSK
ncbi:hypothetical protein TL16_g07161, partial [Triparma laevis f. inornata]